MLIKPRFEQREFDRVRDLRLNRLLQLKDMPPALADRAFTQLLYRNHPYGHLPIGIEGALRAMMIRDITSFHRRAFVPARTTVIAVGDASHDELAAAVQPRVRGMDAGAVGTRSPIPRRSAAPAAPATRLALVHRPGVGAVGAAHRPRRAAAAHARLSRRARRQHDSRRPVRQPHQHEPARGQGLHLRRAHRVRVPPGAGPVRPARQRAVATRPPTRCARRSARSAPSAASVRSRAQELELGRASLTRGYPRNFETADQVARGAAQLALYDLPDDYFTTFVPKVLSLTEKDVTAIAAKHIDPDRLLTVVVGDREKLDAVAERRSELGDVARRQRRSMKAVRFHEHGGPEVLRYEDAPDPHAAAGRAIVRVRACALNHLDLWERRGLDRVKLPLPHISGSDIAGEVDPAGDPGSASCCSRDCAAARCAACAARRDNQCARYDVLGLRSDGGYAELDLGPAREPDPDSGARRFRHRCGVSADLPHRVAHADRRAAGCAKATSCWCSPAAAASARPPSSSRGTSARASSPRRRRQKADRTRALGAEEVFDHYTGDFSREVRRLTERPRRRHRHRARRRGDMGSQRARARHRRPPGDVRRDDAATRPRSICATCSRASCRCSARTWGVSPSSSRPRNCCSTAV